MAYAVTETNGVKVYNLSVGKSLPQYLSESKRKELRKTDEGYRRRIQLLQDFGFDTAAQRVKFARDGIHLAATGTYPPSIKLFDVRELSMKVERRLDAEVVQFQVCATRLCGSHVLVVKCWCHAGLQPITSVNFI